MEQKPGEVAEELASSYERKLIEVGLAASVRLLRCFGDIAWTGPACYADASGLIRHYTPRTANKTKHKMVRALYLMTKTKRWIFRNTK